MNAPHDELPPLEGLAGRALAAEREALPRDGARADRLFSRVLLTVGASVAAGAAGVAISGTAKAAGSAHVAGAANVAGGGAVVASGAVSLKVAVGFAALAFAVGTGTGAFVEKARHDGNVAPSVTAPRTSTAEAPLVAPGAPSLALEPASSSPPLVPSVPVVVRSVPSASTKPPEPPGTVTEGKDADLASERALVDRARSALARGDTAACLDAVSSHETRFPRGRLTEERELVAIQALARDGRAPAAKARADRFRKAHPNSVFLPAVDRLAPP